MTNPNSPKTGEFSKDFLFFSIGWKFYQLVVGKFSKEFSQWIGLREYLQETMVSTINIYIYGFPKNSGWWFLFQVGASTNRLIMVYQIWDDPQSMMALDLQEGSTANRRIFIIGYSTIIYNHHHHHNHIYTWIYAYWLSCQLQWQSLGEIIVATKVIQLLVPWWKKLGHELTSQEKWGADHGKMEISWVYTLW